MSPEPGPKAPGAGLNINRLRRQIAYDGELGTLRWRNTRGSVKSGDPVALTTKDGRRLLRFDGVLYGITTILHVLKTGERPSCRIVFADGNPSNLKWSNIVLQERRG